MTKEWIIAIVSIAATAVGSALITWSSVQTHEYRLDQVESRFEAHLKTHDEQNKAIQQSLLEIKEALGRLSGKADR